MLYFLFADLKDQFMDLMLWTFPWVMIIAALIKNFDGKLSRTLCHWTITVSVIMLVQWFAIHWMARASRARLAHFECEVAS